jgi:hypothetical protein
MVVWVFGCIDNVKLRKFTMKAIYKNSESKRLLESGRDVFHCPKIALMLTDKIMGYPIYFQLIIYTEMIYY